MSLMRETEGKSQKPSQILRFLALIFELTFLAGREEPKFSFGHAELQRPLRHSSDVKHTTGLHNWNSVERSGPELRIWDHQATGGN